MHHPALAVDLVADRQRTLRLEAASWRLARRSLRPRRGRKD